MTDHVLSNNARWPNVIFYKWCCHQAAFVSTFNIGDENKEISLLLIFFIVLR
jgi:hypothetical protein